MESYKLIALAQHTDDQYCGEEFQGGEVKGKRDRTISKRGARAHHMIYWQLKELR